jgi:hypothetical protein
MRPMIDFLSNFPTFFTAEAAKSSSFFINDMI